MARGDHLYVHNLGYSHHGIDCGDGTVIHFNLTPWTAVARELLDMKAVGVERSTLIEFTHGRPVHVRRYDVCDCPDITLERAQSRMGHTDYRVFDNNCEHFAVWCKTGCARSTQVEAVAHASQGLGTNLALGMTCLRLAKRLPGRARLLLYSGALAVTAGSFAVKYAQLRWEQHIRRES